MSDQSEPAALQQIDRAIARDQTIDIVTRGAKTNRWRTVEIWFTRVDGRIIICGTPGATEEGGSKPQAARLARQPETESRLLVLLQGVAPVLHASPGRRSDRR